MEQDLAGFQRDALEMGGEARRQAVAAAGGVLLERRGEAGGGKQRVLAPLQPTVEVGLEGDRGPRMRPRLLSRAVRAPDRRRP